MPNFLTPVSLWNEFDGSLETDPVLLKTEVKNGIKIERLNILGRETKKGRVQIAAAFARNEQSPANETVLILPDSTETIDFQVLEFFVSRGYSAMMVDYRGEWSGCGFYTHYPEDIEFANTAKCGRHKDYVDDSADKTCWYEWVGVGIYAKKYISERTGGNKIAVVGLRDGGEIAWKLGVACDFSCIVPVCAAGWKAYTGINKYLSEEPKLDQERYRFIAGIDSQAYAPYVRCPVLMLCSTNDMRFDYDRAYDTFSRINPDYFADSVITYSVRSNSSIGSNSIADMFMFLDRCLKNRQVFIPKSPVVTVDVDEEENLVAKAVFDDQGIIENCRIYLSEDCTDSAFREWLACPIKSKKSAYEQEYYLNIYDKASIIFVLCGAQYSNGFTVWSKMLVKKIGGKFRNMQSKCRVLYFNRNGTDGFVIANPETRAVGGLFLNENDVLPKLVTKANGISGLYSVSGLSTMRLNDPRFAPSEDSALSVDVFCDETSDLTLTFTDLATGEQYSYTVNVIGGVWQSVISESAYYKTSNGITLGGFSTDMKLSITCNGKYAVNNIMWL